MSTAWNESGSSPTSEEAEPSLGDKIEAFYVTLRTASTAISIGRGGGGGGSGGYGEGYNDTKHRASQIQECLYNVSVCLYDLESHESRAERNEMPDITREIAQDCCKKAAQVLRQVFAEHVQAVVAESRKRLVMKAALDAESSQSHSQRHINALIDLLGTWSNILVNISSLQLSGSCLQMVAGPLHLRIIEMAMECFKQFKLDKRLDDWHRKVMQQAFSLHPTETCSIVALDALLSQISAMREVASQYYTFLDTILLLVPPSAEDATAISSATSPPAVPNLNPPAAEAPTLLGIVTRQERDQWRELDAIYISLEYGYLAYTIREALAQRELLEIESGVRVPQATEDVFYLLHRIAERALVAGSESAALAIGNKIIELLDPNLDDEAAIFRFVSDKRKFYHAARLERLAPEAGKEDEGGEEGVEYEGSGEGRGNGRGSSNVQRQGSANASRASPPSLSGAPHGSSNTPPHAEQGQHSPAEDARSLDQRAMQEQLSSTLGDDIAEELAAGASAIKDVARGVNSWLTGIAGRGRGLLSVPVASGGTRQTDLGYALQEHAKKTDGSAASTVDLLVAALETDADADVRGALELELCMSLEDWGVYLSGLAVPTSSIATVRRLYAIPVNGASCESRQALRIVEQELSRVGVLYARFLEQEARVLLRGTLEKHLDGPLAAAFAR